MRNRRAFGVREVIAVGHGANAQTVTPVGALDTPALRMPHWPSSLPQDDTSASGTVSPVSKAKNGSVLRRVALSSFLGNFIEWFDYATYTYFAIQIGAAFFPADSGINSTLLAFAIFAISFIFRPLGAMFWGSMGDRKGRKWSLSVSIFVMTGAAFLIGILPGYSSIGLAAPLLLLVLRSVQGFSAAGEYSGAAVFLAEYAPVNHRGLYCSLVPASTASGLLAGSMAALAMKLVLPEAAVEEWGWRVPFLIALPLGLVAHFIRTRLEDAPAYKKTQENGGKDADSVQPLRELFSKYRRRLLVSIAATMVNSVGFYLVLTYLPTYLTSYAGLDAALAQGITAASLLVYIALIFLSGKASDLVGRKKMLQAACVLFVAFSVPGFCLLNAGVLPFVIAGQLLLSAILTVNDSNIACYQAEMFPTSVRYTGAAMGSNIAYVLFGGTASFVATALIDATGNGMAPAYYMIAICVVAFLILLFAHEYSGRSMDSID